MENIFAKVQIVSGIGAADIISVLISGLRKLLKLWHDDIVASVTSLERPHPVMDLFPAVYG